ncbi:BMP family lipoprotein [Georgenia sp. SUBG003]|uniref:BMP family lipoprotein n=1 Tax=Georgenia sp. SUBG003 TaxID=1497974 RepID=UPI003AB207F6
MQELGIQEADAESQADSDYGPNVDSMVQQGCNLTIGVGFLLEDPIQSAAEANTDTNFALIDSTFSDADFNPVELENAKPILFNTADAYLAGYVAAAVTETGTVATFGGMQIPERLAGEDGEYRRKRGVGELLGEHLTPAVRKGIHQNFGGGGVSIVDACRTRNRAEHNRHHQALRLLAEQHPKDERLCPSDVVHFDTVKFRDGKDVQRARLVEEEQVGNSEAEGDRDAARDRSSRLVAFFCWR